MSPNRQTEFRTQSSEDYLKVIYEITCSTPRASTKQIADALGVTPASVTGMIKKLSDTRPPLVDYQRHRGVSLTRHGKQIALETLRHHRLLEMFLQQMLGYRWDEVHPEADRLEHVISEEFEERLAQALGDPDFDPHGDPIPGRDLSMPDTPCHPLSDLRQGQRGIVCRVYSGDPELLRYLAHIGLTPNARLAVLDYSPFDQNLQIQIEGQADVIVLGANVTQQILVSLESS